ncbi:MAG: LysE family translocator [Maricaulaceae bacterium]
MSILILFITTTLIVVMSPGPAALTVASQSAGNGMRKAFFGILGVAFANVVYFVMSATGIAALIISSHTAFSVIKWCGVLYLVYLGLSAIFSPAGSLGVSSGAKEKSSTLFIKGFVVEFANPKALLYFAAILPQFIDMSRPVILQLMIMGGITVILDLSIYSVYSYLAKRLTSDGVKKGVITVFNKVVGAALIFAAVKMLSVTAARS